MNQRARRAAPKRKLQPGRHAGAKLRAKTVIARSGTVARKVHDTDVFNIDCPAHHVVARVANKWTLLVLYALTQGTKRYTELQQQIDKISPKMLTQVLRNLEKDALVSRKVYPVVPPMVEYSLTPLGSSLAEQLECLCVWAEENYNLLRKTWRL